MANFQIQNHLGELLLTVSSDELNNLIELAEFNYLEHDSNAENDLVARFQAAKNEDETLDLTKFRIFKLIEE